MKHYYGIRTTPRRLIDANLGQNAAELIDVLHQNDIIYLDRRHDYEDFNFASFKKHMRVQYTAWAKGIMTISYRRESRINNKSPEEVLQMFKEYLQIPLLIDESKMVIDDVIIFSPIIIKTIDLYDHDAAKGSIQVESDLEEMDVNMMKEIRSRFNLKSAALIHAVTVRHLD